MTKVSSSERFCDFGIKGQFGRPFEYGQRIYGEVRYGAEEPKIDTGVDTPQTRFGVYQQRTRHGKIQFVRMNFMQPANPQSGPQQAWRTTFSNGMAAWGLLTDNQKKEYNEKASKINLHGVNLFMREYLNSH